MSDSCIISVACREPYTTYQKRLIETAEALEVPIIYWTDKYPPGARIHHGSLYGFKVYAFKHAFGLGYKHVLWLDSPCYLLSDPYPIFKQIQEDGHYLISTPTPLWKHLNKRGLKCFGLTVEQVKENNWQLLCGSFIGLRKGTEILQKWEQYETGDYFTNAVEDSQQQVWYDGFSGYRHDETMYSLQAYSEGLKLVSHADSHFQNPKAIVMAEKWEIKS